MTKKLKVYLVLGLVIIIAVSVVNNSSSLNSFNSDDFLFSFNYPDYLMTDNNTSLGTDYLLIYPKSVKENSEPLTAIMISQLENKTRGTVEEWLNSPESGYNSLEDGEYDHILIGEQKAVIVGGNWALTNTPNAEKRISISLLAEEEQGAEPLYEEFKKVLDTFSFNQTLE